MSFILLCDLLIKTNKMQVLALTDFSVNAIRCSHVVIFKYIADQATCMSC